MLNKSIEKKWTDPVLVPKNPTEADMSKEWRVRFMYFNDATGTWKPIIRKGGINYIKKFEERVKYCAKVIAGIKKDLELSGWNPITDTFEPPAEEKRNIDKELEELKNSTFAQALDFAAKKKLPEWSKKSGQDYASVIKFLKHAAISIDLHQKR